ncbi:MAG: MFS family permease [Candidatus Methanohalarchaeum thermophilum]|uniref:MFS family permease n=1 Tax=Methanohalarchaeum thermophilum TaxID=1903181 RepID=A0A1Q6DW79_METT1|nr:MAG: MFS family permease [Candidatus Methanohalarchaeum thermophilum]
MADGTKKLSKILESATINGYHYNLLGLFGLERALNGMEVMIISFVLPILTKTWNMSGFQTGLIGSAGIIGMMIGNFFWGNISDRWGRKDTFIYCVLNYSIFGGLTAFAFSFSSGFILRFLTGLGLGGALIVGTSLVTESLPNEARGRFIVYLDGFWPIGNILAALSSFFILSYFSFQGSIALPYLGAIDNWRFLFLLSFLPILIIFPIKSRVRKSPYHLLENGKLEESKEKIKKIFSTKDIQGQLSEINVDEGSSTGFKKLFSEDYRLRSIFLGVIWFTLNFGYYGFFIWLPDTLTAVKLFDNVYLYLILIALVQVPGYLFAAYLIDKLGRKKSLSSFMLLAGLLILIFSLKLDNITQSNLLYLKLILTAASFFAVGSWGIIYAYTSELFPTKIRSMGLGYASGIGKIAGVLGPIIAGLLVSKSYKAATLPLGLSFLIGGTVVILFGKETRKKLLS